ncbi:DUF2149 domain-containing protein [Methanothrix sp.]|uniref:DUF2149 domain-containing protein n=1 Tax=Methanothrix sp. TaxID=90426 RepID=UPI0034E2CC90
MRGRTGVLDEIDGDPMDGVANLFDVAMVFAVALLLALVLSYNISELIDPTSSVTVVKNPGEPDMQIIIKNMSSIQILNMTEQLGGGQGTRIGTAYRLRSGQVIYVPENETSTTP